MNNEGLFNPDRSRRPSIKLIRSDTSLIYSQNNAINVLENKISLLEKQLQKYKKYKNFSPDLTQSLTTNQKNINIFYNYKFLYFIIYFYYIIYHWIIIFLLRSNITRISYLYRLRYSCRLSYRKTIQSIFVSDIPLSDLSNLCCIRLGNLFANVFFRSSLRSSLS